MTRPPLDPTPVTDYALFSYSLMVVLGIAAIWVIREGRRLRRPRGRHRAGRRSA